MTHSHPRPPHFFAPSPFLLDGGAMFGIIPKPLWNKRLGSDEKNRITMTARNWVIRTKNHLIVVDSGTGDYHDPVFCERFGLHYAQGAQELFFAQTGLRCEDVTDVVMTHLHFDHAGGLLCRTEDGAPLKITYPQATLHLSRKHKEYSESPTLRDAGSFQQQYLSQSLSYYQKENKLKLYKDQQGTLEIDEANLRYQCVHGHTPWQLLPYDDQFLFLGDTVPTHAHIDVPWVMGYDMSPGVSAQERLEVYEFLLAQNLQVIFNHDAQYWGAKIQRTAKGGFAWEELYAN